MKELIIDMLKGVLKEMDSTGISPDVTIPENSSHGEFTTNVAMRLAKVLKKPPMEIALQVIKQVKSQKLKVERKGHDQNKAKPGQTTSGNLTQSELLQAIDRIEVVPPGFINIHLSEARLVTELAEVLKEKEGYGTRKVPMRLPAGETGQNIKVSKQNTDTLPPDGRTPRTIMVEFAHPNTHKVFHIGHLRNITTGESVIRLLESEGNRVIRVNYQGDVGMHIAKAIYALLHLAPYNKEVQQILKSKEARQPEKASPFQAELQKTQWSLDIHKKVDFLGKAYAAGSKAFEEDEAAKKAIKDINYLIYAAAQRFSEEKGIEPGTTDYMAFVEGRIDEVGEVYALWKETRQWSLDYFDMIYKRVYSRYDRFYFESQCLAGVDRANEAVKKGVLKKSEGAIIFDGKPYGIDTRVFVNSLGLPTYEGKELALSPMEMTEFGHLDRLIHVVGPEQASFFQVTFKAEELLGIQKNQQVHYIYGWVKLKHGKMSSRSGNVVFGEWLLDEAKKEITAILSQSKSHYTKVQQDEIAEKAAIAAVKYSFLRVSPQSEIAFDLKESVNFEGDSGPYLQYTYARCRSVMRKAGGKVSKHQSFKASEQTIDALTLSNALMHVALNPDEHAVVRLIFQFSDVVSSAAKNLAPSTICNFLNKLAQAYNMFYAKHTILDSAENTTHHPQSTTSTSQSAFRLALTAATAQVLKNGLYLLGIETMEQM